MFFFAFLGRLIFCECGLHSRTTRHGPEPKPVLRKPFFSTTVIVGKLGNCRVPAHRHRKHALLFSLRRREKTFAPLSHSYDNRRRDVRTLFVTWNAPSERVRKSHERSEMTELPPHLQRWMIFYCVLVRRYLLLCSDIKPARYKIINTDYGNDSHEKRNAHISSAFPPRRGGREQTLEIAENAKTPKDVRFFVCPVTREESWNERPGKTGTWRDRNDKI